MKKLKLTAITGVCLGLLLMATGCAKEAAQAEEANNQVEVVENQKTSEDLNKEAAENKANEAEEKEAKDKEDKDKKGEEKSYEVTLTYPSSDYIVNGDEENKKVTEQATIKASKDDIVTKVLKQLAQSPKAEGAESVGLDKFDFSKSKLDGTTAIVDLSGDVAGGSLEEDVLARSIVNSLLSVDGIKAVEFTINGEKAESLMGHVDISEPFTKNL
ncbi:GerMN domain-containing protein [Peptoniphilus sp. EMRHCC_23]|uniref:GerMN domain-containing protein n=1 Tax=Peptoniphilus rachelemmaiella TaxID=2811779 RepID=UPI001BFFDADE|nr:GerMN domain-containing protein [Peptoniphilus rachelemmaiella]